MSLAPSSPPPPQPRGDTFRTVVVGAGIGGLLASIGLALDGHSVVVLEQTPTFGEVGAGMRIPPNSFRVLRRWGVDLTYMKKTHSNGNRFLRYDDGSVLADMPHGVPEWEYGGSYLMVHRADYHAVLLERALGLGVELRPASKVVAYDWDAPAAVLEDGSRVEGDLLVVADGMSLVPYISRDKTHMYQGVQSSARREFQGRDLRPVDTGDISYRILVPGEHMLADPELRDLVSQPWVSSWCGPDAHVIGYPIRGGEIYNVVCCCSERSMRDGKLADGETKAVIPDNGELVRRFEGWEPRVRKIVGLAGKVAHPLFFKFACEKTACD